MEFMKLFEIGRLVRNSLDFEGPDRNFREYRARKGQREMFLLPLEVLRKAVRA